LGEATKMVSYFNDGEQDATEEQMLDQDGLDSAEEGFMKGYSEDDEVIECSECGSAVSDEKKIVKEIEGEKVTFCSETCAKEYEESLGSQ
tara:strand:- start:75 stop:344 length:270 start_codon:yes stop_codon:yes gene_type:complete